MAKYQIRATRFVDGHLVRASPQKPAVIEVPDNLPSYKYDDKGRLLDAQLISLDDPRSKVAPKPHYVAQKIVQPTAVEYFSVPTEDAPVEAPVETQAAPAKPAKGKRAADTDVA